MPGLAPAGAAPQFTAIAPAAGAADSHRLDPAHLLYLGQAIHGRTPVVQLLRVRAYRFEYGTALSPELKANLAAARALPAMRELSLLETLRIESAMAECARSQNTFRRLELGRGHTSSPRRS